MPLLLTVGHGTLDQDAMAELLRNAGITHVVDVRRYPSSRQHPQFAKEALTNWLPEQGFSYRWDEHLGGRRRTPPDSPDVWWRVDAFRGYAQHMRTSEFSDAMAQLLGQLESTTTAIMCSESLWWRCHRRLIADAAVLAHGVMVRHLLHNGRLVEHVVAAGVRLVPPETIFYDLAKPAGCQ